MLSKNKTVSLPVIAFSLPLSNFSPMLNPFPIGRLRLHSFSHEGPLFFLCLSCQTFLLLFLSV